MSAYSTIKTLTLLFSVTYLSLPAHSSPPHHPAGKVNQAHISILKSASDELAKIFESASPSVVIIESPPLPTYASVWDSSPSGENSRSPEDTSVDSEEEEMPDTASGIIFTPDLHIITNHHVIQNVIADYVRVKLSDGRVVRAKIIGSDPKTDIAVLRLPELTPAPPPLRRADSDKVRVGEFVCAIGSPYGLEYTFTVGIVSGRGRNPLTFSAYEDYIQTDTAINPGNSGGPLLNEKGEWIGMNTLINGINRGLGFAVPSNQAIKIASEIIDKGSVLRPWLGIRLVAPMLMEEGGGLEISWVSKGSPAEKAGLRPRDIIVSINGNAVTSPAELQRKIWSAGVAGIVALEVRRGRSVKTRKINTVEMPENEWIH
jgi:S1-C subfamily serine protease